MKQKYLVQRLITENFKLKSLYSLETGAIYE